jgi:ribulose-phosphate 3-epimerase
MIIIPAILTDNPGDLSYKLELCSGVVNLVQIDVNDGTFQNNKTLNLSSLERKDIDVGIDIHLMTKNPIDWIERAARVGAERIIAQVEYMEDQVGFVSRVQGVGAKVGLALDMATAPDSIDKQILNDLDVVLVMGYQAGIANQEFNQKALLKVKELNKLKKQDENPFSICVDGGVNRQNIGAIAQAGADEVAVGRSIFNGDLKQNIDILLSKI